MSNTTSGREHPFQLKHYFRKRFIFSDTAIIVGTLPPRAIVVNAGIVVTTVFQGSTPTFDLGVTGVGDDFADGISLETIGVIRDASNFPAATRAYNAEAIDVIGLVISAATAGEGIAWVEYLPDNDG